MDDVLLLAFDERKQFLLREISPAGFPRLSVDGRSPKVALDEYLRPSDMRILQVYEDLCQDDVVVVRLGGSPKSFRRGVGKPPTWCIRRLIPTEPWVSSKEYAIVSEAFARIPAEDFPTSAPIRLNEFYNLGTSGTGRSYARGDLTGRSSD